MTYAVFDFEDIARRVARKPEPVKMATPYTNLMQNWREIFRQQNLSAAPVFVSVPSWQYSKGDPCRIIEWSNVGDLTNWKPDPTSGSCDVE